MPRVGLEPTTYRFLAGILCHWDTEASLHAFLAHEHEWTGRDSNPQGRKTAGLQPTTLPITFYPSICSPTLASSTLGGTRTHNKPRLKRLPLPIGAPGHELDDDIATTSSGWRGTRTPKARRQLVYSQRRYRLRAIHPRRPRALRSTWPNTLGGVRTHNIPILSRHPLPVGTPGLMCARGCHYKNDALSQCLGWESNPQHTDP